MSTQRAVLYTTLMFFGTLVYALIVYPSLPAIVPIHWNWRGEADGWGSRNWIFLGPGLDLIAVAMLYVLPALSPARYKIDTFRGTFNSIVVLCAALFACIAIFQIQGAKNEGVLVGKWLVATICIFLALMGNLMGKVRRNFFVGVRTPWTLASDRVWNMTHRVAGHWMVVGGTLAALLAIAGAPLALAFTVMMVAALYPVLFSFLYYKRLKRSDDL